MACTFSVEFEAKSDAQKIWDFVKNFHIICRKAFPQVFDSVEVVEGDGNSTGTVRVIKYVPGTCFNANSLIDNPLKIIFHQRIYSPKLSSA